LSEAFYTSFVYYSDFKWDNDRYYQYPIILSNLYFAVCLDYYSIFYAREPDTAHGWVAYLGLFALGLFAFELIQLKVESAADYFSDEANIIELFGYCLFMLYAFNVL